MPERNPQIIAERNPATCLRRSPRFISETRISVEYLGKSKPSARNKTAPDSFFTSPCSRIAKTQRNFSQDGVKKDAKSKISTISRRKSARLDSKAAFSCLDLQNQCVIEKRVTRSSTGGIKHVNYKEWNGILGKRDGEIRSLPMSSKGSNRSARLDDRGHVCRSEEDRFPHKQYQIEKRLTRRSLYGIDDVIEISDSDWEEDSRKRVRILSKNQKSKVGGDTLKKNVGKIEKMVNRRSSDEKKDRGGDTLKKNIGEIKTRANGRSSDERKHKGDNELSKLCTNKKDAKDCGVTLISCDQNGKRTQGEKSKRYQVEEESEADHGWTKEQVLSLRRAYFVAKPTPQFWKKVARMVMFYSLPFSLFIVNCAIEEN